MVCDTHIPQKSVIGKDPGSQLDNLWFVLVVEIAFHESFVEFNDLTEG